MSDFQASASLYSPNQYYSSCSELECPTVDATWIETASKKASLKVIYYYCFDEQSPASFFQLLLKGDISQSVKQDLEYSFQRKRKRKKTTQIHLKHKLNLHDYPIIILDALQTTDVGTTPYQCH